MTKTTPTPCPWNSSYRIEGATFAFAYTDRDTGRTAAVLGYPTDKLAQAE